MNGKGWFNCLKDIKKKSNVGTVLIFMASIDYTCSLVKTACLSQLKFCFLRVYNCVWQQQINS